ncbi:MAG: DUF2203 family protein [Planctomycetes bacterium]|nr:DUF2203 family protein [Planctomycetota bacterium]
MGVKVPTQQLFSLESANRMLPLIRVIVSDIVDLYRDVREREERLRGLGRGDSSDSSKSEADPYGEEVEQVRIELEKDVDRLQGYLDELQDLGVEFKDPIMGLVDFPAMFDGEEIHLCWKLGEPTISHWHRRDTGYSGRQKIEEGTMQ